MGLTRDFLMCSGDVEMYIGVKWIKTLLTYLKTTAMRSDNFYYIIENLESPKQEITFPERTQRKRQSQPVSPQALVSSRKKS